MEDVAVEGEDTGVEEEEEAMGAAVVVGAEDITDPKWVSLQEMTKQASVLLVTVCSATMFHLEFRLRRWEVLIHPFPRQ